jgi:autotransporter-associated beta strand protein
MHKKQILIMSVAILGLAAGVVRAQSWTGGGGADRRWSNPANWNTGVPAVGAIATLANSPLLDAPQAIDLNVNVSLDRLICNSTGNRHYTITTTNSSKITLTGGHDIYADAGTRTTALTINCNIIAAPANLQVRRIGGTTTLNGNCGGAYLYAQYPGELVLTGSNNFNYVYMYGGEIFVKNPFALLFGFFQTKVPTAGTPDGILSLASNATIPGNLDAEYPLRLRLRDSGTNNVTLTVGGRCLSNRITIAPNAGTSTGRLTIRLLTPSSHLAEWTLATNSTLIFANTTGNANWGDAANGMISGDGDVRIESGSATVVLYCTNDYTGGTVIHSGTLQPAGNDRLPVAGDLTIAAAGKFYLNSTTQTVARLSGDGTLQFTFTAGSPVPGRLTVTEAFAPGAPVGTLVCTNKGTLVLGPACTSVFQLGALAGTSDRVALRSSNTGIALGGTLEVNAIGRLRGGDYTLFDLSGGPITGSFSSIIMPPYYRGEIDTSSGDVVLKVKEPPAGTLLIVN